MNIVKESLAKLLATENLIVEHRPVETAMFDVTNRVLTLPTQEVFFIAILRVYTKQLS